MLRFFQDKKNERKTAYLSSDFFFRFKKVQKLLVKQGLHALLLVAGPDSCSNPDTARILAWLLSGVSGSALHNSTSFEDCYSDLIMVIRADGCSVYMGSAAHQRLKKFFYIVPNLQVCVLPESMQQTPDEIDLLRIQFFYKAVSGLKKIGVPHLEKEARLVEKWPMVKSFALQQIGTGFFSQNFNVVGLSQKIRQLFKNHDRASLQALVQNAGVMLAGHVLGATNFFELTQMKKRCKITEAKINEVLKTAIQISEVQRKGITSAVLFGTNTNKDLSSEQSFQELQPVHFTVEYTDPYSSMRVGRTYFLSRQFKQYMQVKEDIVPQVDTLITDLVYSLQLKQNSRYSQEQKLLTCYLTLIEGLQDALRGISRNYKNLMAPWCKSAIWARLQSLTGLGQQQLEVQLACLNGEGQQIQINFKDSIAFILTPNIFYLKAKLSNILHEGKNIGAVLYCESFILQEGCFYLLTAGTKLLDFWQADNALSSHVELVKHYCKFEEIGKFLIMEPQFGRVFYFSANPMASLTPSRCDLYFCEKGIRIKDHKFGWYIITYKDMRRVQIINRYELPLFYFQLKNAPVCATLGATRLMLELKTQSFNFVLSRLNNKLDPIPYSTESNYPEQIKSDPSLPSKGETEKKAPIANNQIFDFKLILDYLQAKQLMILAGKKDFKIATFMALQEHRQISSDPEARKLVLICGGFASGKSRFAQTLRKIDHTVSIFKLNYPLYDLVQKQAFLEMLAQQLNTLPRGTVAVVVPSWLNSRQIIGQIAQFKGVQITNVVFKVSSNVFYGNVFKDGCWNHLLGAAPGYNQYLLLDNFNEAEKDVSTLYQLLQQLFREANIIRVTNNNVHSEIAKQILEKPRFSSDLHQFYRQKYQCLSDCKLDKLQIKFIKFQLPVAAGKLRRVFHKVVMGQHRGFLINREGIRNSLERYAQEARTSEDPLTQGLFQLRHRIAVAKEELKGCRILYCKFVHRKLQFLDEGIYEASICGMAFMERPVRGVKTIIEEGVPKYKGSIPELGLIVIGFNLDLERLKQQLQSYTLRDQILSQLKQPMGKRDVTPQILVRLSKENIDNLDHELFYYDGTFFRNREGQHWVHHPKVDQFVEAMLVEENQKIEQHNAEVAAKWQQYVAAMTLPS